MTDSAIPKKPVRPTPPEPSPSMEAAGLAGNAGPGPAEGGCLEAGTPCEAAAQREGASDQSDLELVALVRDRAWERGGSEAFWKLWLRYETRIWSSVRRASFRVCPPHVAVDVFAEALLERVQLGLVRGVKHYHGPAPFGAFLKKTIINAGFDQYWYYRARRESSASLDPGDAGDLDTADDSGGESPQIYRTRSYPSPDHVAAAKEARAMLREALRLVAMRSAAAVHWAGALRRFYLEELTGDQIAREMGCTPSAVHKYLERGRKELKAVLQQTYGVGSIEDVLP